MTFNSNTDNTYCFCQSA